ncbi:hypothetical protein EK904_013675, partial [Melospiza melodia maxima]
MGYPTGYPTAAPAYNPNMYPTSSPGYAPATLLMKQAWPQTSSSCTTEGTFHLPVDTGTENRTYQASSAAFRYTAGTPYKGAYYTQPVYAAQPHVIHHTTVVQPNSIPSAIYPAPVAAPRTNGVAMGMVAGTTMAMSAGKETNGGKKLPLRPRNLVDHPPTHRHRSTSSVRANVQGSRNPHLQLHPESNIVCNYTSLTSVLRPLGCSA